MLAENANVHEQNQRLAQHIREFEDRLSELLGQQAFKRLLDERDEDLAAARETNRRLMNQLNRSVS